MVDWLCPKSEGSKCTSIPTSLPHVTRASKVAKPRITISHLKHRARNQDPYLATHQVAGQRRPREIEVLYGVVGTVDIASALEVKYRLPLSVTLGCRCQSSVFPKNRQFRSAVFLNGVGPESLVGVFSERPSYVLTIKPRLSCFRSDGVAI